MGLELGLELGLGLGLGLGIGSEQGGRDLVARRVGADHRELVQPKAAPTVHAAAPPIPAAAAATAVRPAAAAAPAAALQAAQPVTRGGGVRALPLCAGRGVRRARPGVRLGGGPRP